MKLSDYVLGFVADLGVKNVFLVTGGGAMHLKPVTRCAVSDYADLQFSRAGIRHLRRGLL